MNRNFEITTVEAHIQGQYLVDTPVTKRPAPLLVGFHGYGENAARHLAELRRLPGASQWLLVSVDALHRFYRQRHGTVVGSWMTRENREAAIAHNTTYVKSVVEKVMESWPTSGTLVFAGFSQGVAMAYRAAAGCGLRCHGIIALAGDVPPELADTPSKAWPPVLVARGQDDAWYTQAKMEQDLRILGDAADSIVFAGGHEWSDEFRHAAGAFLARCQASTTNEAPE